MRASIIIIRASILRSVKVSSGEGQHYSKFRSEGWKWESGWFVCCRDVGKGACKQRAKSSP